MSGGFCNAPESLMPVQHEFQLLSLWLLWLGR